MKLHDGVERIWEDVRYVPELKKKILISLGVFDRSGTLLEEKREI